MSAPKTYKRWCVIFIRRSDAEIYRAAEFGPGPLAPKIYDDDGIYLLPYYGLTRTKSMRKEFASRILLMMGYQQARQGVDCTFPTFLIRQHEFSTEFPWGVK